MAGRRLTRDELFVQLQGLRPDEGDVIYVARSGDDYRATGGGLPSTVETASTPDTWLYYSGQWPQAPERFPAFFDELLAEMDSMAGGVDRCRWPLNEPWPHSH